MFLGIQTGFPILDNIILILILLLIISFFIGIVLFIFSIYVFRITFIPPKEFKRGKTTPKWKVYEKEQIAHLKEFDSLEKEDVFINGYKGKKAHGYFIKSKSDSKKVVIFVHGWKSHGLNDYICGGMCLHRQGYNVLVIDQYAHGQSEGKYISFARYDKENLKSWINYVNEKFNDNCKIYLMGMSMGSSTVLWLAGDDLKNVSGIIGDSGYYNGYDLALYFIKRKLKFFPSVVAFMTRVIALIICKFDIKKCDLQKAMVTSKYPILFLYGDKDDFVPIEHTINAYNDCRSKKEIVMFEDCDHIVAGMKCPEKYVKSVINFIEKY